MKHCKNFAALISDFGVDHLEEFADQCKFPWLMSNVKDIVNNEPLARGETYVIIDHGGIKVGEALMYKVNSLMNAVTFMLHQNCLFTAVITLFYGI